MSFHSSQHNQARSPPDVEITSSAPQHRSSYRTPFVPKHRSAIQNTRYPLSFLEILNKNKAKIEGIFNASVPENSKQYQMQRDLWMYLVKMIESRSYSDGFSLSTATEPSQKKRKIEAHTIPVEIEAWKRKLNQWKHLNGYDGRIGQALDPRELYGLISSVHESILHHSSPTPSSPGNMKPRKHWNVSPSSSLSSL